MRQSATAEPIGGTSGPRVTRAIVGVLAIFSLVLRVVLAAIPMPASITVGAAALVPVCTAYGVKWVNPDPEAPVKPANTSVDCPLCIAAHGLTLLVPLSDLPQPITVMAAATVAFFREAPTLRIAARPPPSRGPPPLLSANEPRIESL